MSLDISLKVSTAVPVEPYICVRENGRNIRMSPEEWNERFPDRIPYMADFRETKYVYEGNITHNLARMADEAGLYDILWCPEESGIEKAEDLIEPLCRGIRELAKRPDFYKQFNPANGWGDYWGLLRFALEYLNACTKYRQAKVVVSR